MTLPRLVPLEKSLAVLALAGACGATGWWWQQQAGLRRLRAERGAVALTGSAYAPATLPVVESAAEPWTKPRAQAAGAAWIYELFTPPVIYYHASARSFAVFPPASFTESATQVFGVELLAVKREPFRLQLVGYVGTPGDYVGAFVSSQVPETLLARSGRRFAQLGLALKSLEVRKVDASSWIPPRSLSPGKRLRCRIPSCACSNPRAPPAGWPPGPLRPPRVSRAPHAPA